MKTVILLRHGKSSWDSPDLDDHDRPLAPRGQRAAPVVAEWLAERGYLPDVVLCSTARRTRETWELVARTLATRGLAVPAVRFEQRLYHAPPGGLLARLAALEEAAERVMLVGHNPGLSALARKLSGPIVRPGCARAFQHFPTAAAAVLTAELTAWSKLHFGSAAFVDFAKPRELEAVR